jgi:hypothetical protein
MKFLYADSLDFVDPNYNFLEDRSAPGRETYWDDEFPHQYLGKAPFDGLLISRGVVGDHKFPGKYTQSQAMRFRREGARKFIRIDTPEFAHLDIFGDCGAFSYADLEDPPYTPSEIIEFYEDGRFSHGCSVDHIIFEFDRSLRGMESLLKKEVADRARKRFDITLENAEVFYKECGHLSQSFTPLGVVQGWSAGSMAEAARRLVGMGYDYLAVGGMVPLGTDTIKEALTAIRELIPDYVKLHILGFGKIDHIDEFANLGIASFDTTSPMLRAFKDNVRNFFMPSNDSKLQYYTAIRIPQATENKSLDRLKKKGVFTQEFLLAQEKAALDAVRELDKGRLDTETALEVVMDYTRSHLTDPRTGKPPSDKKLGTVTDAYRITLTDRPWQKCPCGVCQKVSVESVIFRASNRNKRRGIHNMWVFNTQLKRLIGQENPDGEYTKVQGRSSTTKR